MTAAENTLAHLQVSLQIWRDAPPTKALKAHIEAEIKKATDELLRRRKTATLNDLQVLLESININQNLLAQINTGEFYLKPQV